MEAGSSGEEDAGRTAGGGTAEDAPDGSVVSVTDESSAVGVTARPRSWVADVSGDGSAARGEWVCAWVVGEGPDLVSETDRRRPESEEDRLSEGRWNGDEEGDKADGLIVSWAVGEAGTTTGVGPAGGTVELVEGGAAGAGAAVPAEVAVGVCCGDGGGDDLAAAACFSLSARETMVAVAAIASVVPCPVRWVSRPAAERGRQLNSSNFGHIPACFPTTAMFEILLPFPLPLTGRQWFYILFLQGVGAGVSRSVVWPAACRPRELT